MFLAVSSMPAMAVLTAALGLLTFGAVPPLQARLLSIAERHQLHAVDVAAGLNIAGFNSGIVFGPALGGVAMSLLGVTYAALPAAIAGGAGLVLLLVQQRPSGDKS